MIIIRKAKHSDMKLYFNWANDKAVRDNSFHSEPISLDSHRTWFKNKLNDNSSFLYVAKNNNIPIGQIRFQIDDNHTAELSFSLKKEARGRGLGKQILKLAIEKLSNDCSKVASIKAHVKKTNISSNKIFTQLDFNIDEKHQSESAVTYQLQLPRRR
ncbi:GNAT family N-acetyltransferase [Thermodesulfobacteriota bacterium]